MCKDDDRVIESLVSQINDLQEELEREFDIKNNIQ